MPTLQKHSDAAMIQTAEWALSQPTPTAEPRVSICDCGHARGEHSGPDGRCTASDCRCWGHVHKEFFGDAAAPLSIAEMAPGTTFVQAVMWTVTASDRGHKYARRPVGQFGSQIITDYDIDPSTIRDVTPPEVTS